MAPPLDGRNSNRGVRRPVRAVASPFAAALAGTLLGLFVTRLVRPTAPSLADAIATVAIGGPVVAAVVVAAISALRRGRLLASLAFVGVVPATWLLVIVVGNAVGAVESDLTVGRTASVLIGGALAVGTLVHLVGLAGRALRGGRAEFG